MAGRTLVATIPHPKVRGRVSLGPVPGTPEFAFEQRCKAAGVSYVAPDSPHRAAIEAAVNEYPPDTQRAGE